VAARVVHSPCRATLWSRALRHNGGGRFPNVKLLSQYVTQGAREAARGVPARILLKGVADAGGKAVTLIVTALAARALVPDAFGVMALAMTTGWLLGVATDAGLSMYLARETARHRAHARALVGEVMGLRTATAYSAAAIAALFSSWFVPPHWRLQFTLIVLAQLTSAVLDTLAHFFRGLERSEIESALHLAQRALTLGLAVAVLWWWPRLDYLGAALLAPPLVALLIGGMIAARYDGLRVPGSGLRKKSEVLPNPGARRPAPGSELFLTPSVFFRDVLPLGAGVLLSALYFRIDLFFIERWHGLEPVGAYNAVFRLVEAMRLLPAAVMAVTFPLLVQTRDTRLVQRIGGSLSIAGVLLAALCIGASSWIVIAVYGVPYGYAAPAFAVLSLALPLFFLNYALTHQLIGWDGQRAYLGVAALALVANVAANVALVPSQGMVGAAAATVITELVVTAGCLYALRPPSREALRRDSPQAMLSGSNRL
jgi:O-antigen/teichoic acid export membrane protein